MAIIKWETIAVIACIVTCLMVKTWLPGLWKETKNVGFIRRGCIFWGRVSKGAATPTNPVGCFDSGWILEAQLRDTSLGPRQNNSLKKLIHRDFLFRTTPRSFFMMIPGLRPVYSQDRAFNKPNLCANTCIPDSYHPWRRLSPSL